MRQGNLAGHGLAFLTICIWSATFLISKVLLEYLEPVEILILRFILAILFLSLIYPRFSLPRSWREEGLFLLAGIGLALYFYLENSALKHTYASNVSLIVATIPLLTGLLARLILKTPFIRARTMIGLVVAYLGVLLIILNGHRLTGVEPAGDFLALGAALMFAFYSVLMQKITRSWHLIELTRKVFIYGLAILLLIRFFSPGPLTLPTLTGQLIAGLLFLGIIASSLAFIFWNRAIKLIGPVRTNQYIYLIPVMTSGLSALILSEKITLLTIAGTGLILAGLAFSDFSLPHGIRTTPVSAAGRKPAAHQGEEPLS